MELWIRSQDRETLMLVNHLDIYCLEDGTPEYYIEECGVDMGCYKNKERALEVLDEIQNILKPQILIRRNDDNDKILLGALQKGVTQKMDIEFKELSTVVYEMPKE